MGMMVQIQNSNGSKVLEENRKKETTPLALKFLKSWETLKSQDEKETKKTRGR